MKYFKLAVLAFTDRLKTNMILLLQLTLVFVLVNVLIGSVNSRDILYEPYKDILNKQGWYMTYYDFEGTGSTAKNLFDSEKIRPVSVTVCEAFGFDSSGNYYRIAVMSDELFDKLSLPVTDSASGSERIYAFSGKKLLRAGDSVVIRLGENIKTESVAITDILTDPTYYPSFSKWNIDGDVSMLYRQISSETDKDNFLIMSLSASRKVGIPENSLNTSPNSLVYYPQEISEEQFEAEEKRLGTNENAACISLSALHERTENKLEDDRRRFVPLGLISAIVVLIGTAGAIAIQTLKEMKSYAVLYLCGMKWRRIVFISLFKVLIMLAAAGMVTGAVMFFLHSSNIAAGMGMAFNITNLYISLALAALTLFSSILLPFILLRKASPAETIRRIKND